MLNYSTYHHQESTIWVTFVHGAGGSSSVWFKQIPDFQKHFNILLVDLRGHGKSKLTLNEGFNEKYTFNLIADDIVEVLAYLNIKKSHFIGISLGTVLVRNVGERYPHLVESMVLGGAVMKLGFRAQMFMRLGNIIKTIVPYMWLYKFFTFMVMPYKNHKESRSLLIKEAKKLQQQEFLRWSKLTSEINPALRVFRTTDAKIPSLYVMGGEDYLFSPGIKKLVQKHDDASLLLIEHCGHMVNVEQPEIFNSLVLNYVSDISWESILVQEALKNEKAALNLA